MPYDVLVVDTESTDGTRELVRAFPVRLTTIHTDEFDHGDTRNQAISLTLSEVVVFLTQDAIPADDRWLAALLEEFDDPRVAGAYSRNLAPPGASPLVAGALERDPCGRPERRVHDLKGGGRGALEAASPLDRRLLCDFNDVSSALRRSVWERFPFPRTSFGEDVLWARGALEAGHRIVYTPESRVFHGHDDGVKTSFRRAEIDGRFNAEHLGRICIRSLPDAVRHGLGLARSDDAIVGRSGLRRRARLREGLRAPVLRVAQMTGLWAGGRSRIRRAAPSMLKSRELRILFTVHGYPPESTAGTEVHTRELARELASLGHDVSVVFRSTRTDLPDLSVFEGRDGAVRLFGIANRLDYRHAGESYVNSQVEVEFRRILEHVGPDVVHFQHLLHLSAGLPRVAKEHGVPSVLTLNDYWFLCPRVQLQRPNGVNCTGRRELGCLLCLKHRYLRATDTVTRASRLLRPVIEAYVRRSEAKARRGWILRKRDRDLVDFHRRDARLVGALTSVDLVIAPSRFLRELHLRQVPELDEHRIVRSDYGIRSDALRRRPRSAGTRRRFRFGFVGSLVPYKGIAIVIEAMNRLGDPRAELHVFGPFDPLTDPFHAEIQASALRGNVVFRGPFENGNVGEVLAELDALVVPSTWFENAPLTIREAHAAGVPVVTSRLGGMAESVREGLDGWTFEAGDPSDLAATLARVAEELPRARLEFPDRKTIEENAREMEFRYRALAAARAGSSRRILAAFRGVDGAETEGAVERQGDGALLLRPGPRVPCVSFSVAAPGAFPALVKVQILVLGAEPETVQGGFVEVNGVKVGAIDEFRPLDGRDAIVDGAFPARLREGANVVKVVSGGTNASPLHLRLRRLAVEALEP